MAINDPFDRLNAALNLSADEGGALLHAAWETVGRVRGFHGPEETCQTPSKDGGCLRNYDGRTLARCPKFNADLVPWTSLSESQKDIDRAAFEALRTEIRRRASL